jgi:hypothetical protein
MTLFLLYMLYKYLFLWCMQQPPSQDTGGLFFPKAINHVVSNRLLDQQPITISNVETSVRGHVHRASVSGCSILPRS